MPVNNPTIWFVSFCSVHMLFRPSQTLEKQSISLWEKHFVCWKIFCKMRTCRSTAIEYKLRIFLCIISLRRKVSIVPFGLTKAHITFQLLIYLWDRKSFFLFCMLKNFAWDKNLQTYCKTKMSENFSCVIAVSRKSSIVPFGLTNAPVTFQQLIVSGCLFWSLKVSR